MKYTVFSTPLIIAKCPDNITEAKCPLRTFIKEQDVFHVSVNENYLIPNAKCGYEKVAKTVIKMREICATCNSKNKVKTH